LPTALAGIVEATRTPFRPKKICHGQFCQNPEIQASGNPLLTQVCAWALQTIAMTLFEAEKTAPFSKKPQWWQATSEKTRGKPRNAGPFRQPSAENGRFEGLLPGKGQSAKDGLGL